MKRLHSPAPWKGAPLGHGHHITAADGTQIAVFYGGGTNPRSPFDRAAALAAPDLLTMCLRMQAWIEAATQPDADGGCYLNGDSETFPGDAWVDLETIGADLDAAVLKATEGVSR